MAGNSASYPAAGQRVVWQARYSDTLTLKQRYSVAGCDQARAWILDLLRGAGMTRSIAVARKFLGSRLATLAAALVVLSVAGALAQNPQLEEKLMALKQSQAMNKQKLAQYTWQETETISIKGSVKDTKMYQVQVGPNGQQQKT